MPQTPEFVEDIYTLDKISRVTSVVLFVGVQKLSRDCMRHQYLTDVLFFVDSGAIHRR